MSDIEKKLVTWSVFIWIIGVITFLIAGSFTMSGNAILNTNQIKERVGVIEERENNHYTEVIKILERIENKLNKN